MANDKFHHKRKARREADLKRKKASRAPYDRVLIVCEGLKTEPNYLSELISDLKLNTANIFIDGDCESNPTKILAHAQALFKQAKQDKDPYDKVFCVFDKDDGHGGHYESTIASIASDKSLSIFQSITSVPCFEYFLLLHFKYSDKPYHPKQNQSICDCVIQELWEHIPSYSKAKTGVYNETKEKLPTAIGHSKRALASAQRTATDNPTTQMHLLVAYLQKLRS